MTREEAMLLLHDMKDTYDEIHENTNCEIGYEQMTALDMAIEALSADTVSREAYHNLVTASNDIDRALREYQDKEENGELVSVVRCKDCRHAHECHKSVQYTRNEPRTVTIGYTPIEFCSHGERREE